METLVAEHICCTQLETGVHLVSASGITKAFDDHGRGDFDFQSTLPSECFTLKDVEVAHMQNHSAANTRVYVFTSF
jgi:hypothetical protein